METLGLDDDNVEEFRGGTLQIKQEQWRMSTDTEPMASTPAVPDNDLNANIDSGASNGRQWVGSQLIALPKRITDTLWNCKNNNADGTVANTGPATDNAHDYFTSRAGVVERAVQDCVQQVLDVALDGDLVAAFLLTEISVWDAEKERLVILASRSLVCVKYDFIALKQLEHRRVPLDTLDSIVLGALVYPQASLVPRLNGLASGVTNVMRGCLLDRWSQRSPYFGPSLFEARNRKTDGVRLLWNKGAPVGFTQRWNPFSADIPYLTFTSHPLHRHPECLDNSTVFSVAEFSRMLVECVEAVMGCNTAQPERSCVVQHKDIELQTYLGLGSLIHNRNALGFFKVRGKFSF